MTLSERYKGVTTPQSASLTAPLARGAEKRKEMLRGQLDQQFQTRFARVLLAHLSARTLPTNSPLDCLLNGNEPAISDALRARFTGSPIGSHVAYKQSTGLFA